MKPSQGAGLALIAMCAFLAQPTDSLMILEILKIAQMSFNSFSHTWDLFEGKLQPEPGMYRKLLHNFFYTDNVSRVNVGCIT